MLLAFTAVHAKADNALDRTIAVQPGAGANQPTPVYSPLDPDSPITPVGTSTSATINRNMASLAGSTPIDAPTFTDEDNASVSPAAATHVSAPAPAPLALAAPVTVAVATPRPAVAPASVPAPAPVLLAVAAPDSKAASAPAPVSALKLAAAPVEPRSVAFNSQFLVGSAAKSLDISRYGKGNFAMPGRYRAALYANEIWIGSTEVTLRDLDGQGKSTEPVFDRDLLMRIGVDVTRLADTARAALDAADKSGGVPLRVLIPQATAMFDAGEQRLDVSIPQAMMSRNARGWVDPKFWDDGVPAAVVQYNANVYHSSGKGFSNTQSYLGLNTGVNIGPWRFRYNGSITHSAGAGTHVQSMQTFMQRSFEPIKSQLTLGDSYTDGSIFDSFGIRGAQIGTDDRMYPESQRGYAPTVRGIANTNAKVEVRQGGNVLYETTVAPGPFEIDDLYATGYGGDLQVVVTEADGSQHVSLLPYSAPVNALREGRWRYNVAAGLYHNTSLNTSPFVFQTGVQHGLNNLVTLYGGAMLGENYVSAAAGIALDTPAGAVGFDVTQAHAQIGNLSTHNGQSLRLSYSRTFAPTDTAVTLAAYRYSTSGFLDFQDAMALSAAAKQGTAYVNQNIQKGRLQLTVNQNLFNYGSVYASGFTQNYWNRGGRDTSFQVGYNTSIRRVGVGVSASRELEAQSSRWSNRFMLNFSIPLDLGASTATSMTSFSHDSRDNRSEIQETFTGAAGKDFEFNYGVTAGHAWGDGTGNSLSVNAGYLSRIAQLRGNAGSANGYRQAGVGATGTLIAYDGGVVMTPQTGDTFAVIEAKDASGARVASSPGVHVDRFGHAVIAGMQPFSLNTVEIDTKGLPMGVELKSTEQHFAPTAGAVVRVKFDSENRGQAAVMRVHRANGDVVPFGADVLDSQGNIVGTVSQGSRAMLYVRKPDDQFTIKWGEQGNQTCKLHYALPDAKATRPGARAVGEATCQ
ncbi:fimbria/pilus outer membrane usher protein [Caballeronia sp. ATUFL_M2_KS44]|uniref:fimbria/pilus outer membrane usher protein n=1 Tax=Caballeronia sp. ATUFL_M2_KS44 TaxID=2921767 RepID=UPI0020297035